MNDGKKISLNFILGILSEVLTIVLGVLIPRFMLTGYGSEVNGLITSVTQIYGYIGLVEAGIGMAALQGLYKTVGNKDRQATNEILSATNIYYHRTGYIYMAVIGVFAVVYPLVIKTDIPVITIILVILFNGAGSVINFFFQGKYFILFQAEGKNYIGISLNMATNVFKNIAKIILIHQGFDIVFVQAIAMVVSLLQMFYVTYHIKKYYKWIDLKAKPNYSALSQSKNVLVHQVSGLVFNNTDTILLTFFCGLKVVSVYSIYTMLFAMISTAISTITQSVVFKLGQTYNTSKEQFIKLFDAYEVYRTAIVFSLYSVANFFILPFIKLYTAGVSDINYIDDILPLLFISTYLLSSGRNSSSYVIQFAGHFKQTQWRSILESVINVVVSVIAVHFWGIYGVLIGTIAALLYRTNDMIIYANKKILKRNPWYSYRRWLINVAIFIVILFINRFLTPDLSSYLKIILWCIPYLAVTLILYFSIVSIVEKQSFRYIWSVVKNKMKKK
ncbi:MAG: polysaccharide biosynthesis C-terminal domain-containing protein [Clostridia bacterium]|nr:polysaccharide biosynthesis C-terminal domain-containing protein [Clostridia bacterium]